MSMVERLGEAAWDGYRKGAGAVSRWEELPGETRQHWMDGVVAALACYVEAKEELEAAGSGGVAVAKTFEGARREHLGRLDAEYAALRGIVSDPAWCNEHYPKFTHARERLLATIDRVRRLNAAAAEAGEVGR